MSECVGEWVRGRDLSVPVGCRDETDFARVAIPEVGGGGLCGGLFPTRVSLPPLTTNIIRTCLMINDLT